jgi:hypothetical protein
MTRDKDHQTVRSWRYGYWPKKSSVDWKPPQGGTGVVRLAYQDGGAKLPSPAPKPARDESPTS